MYFFNLILLYTNKYDFYFKEGTTTTICAFGMNNFCQVEADSPQALYRSPTQVSRLTSKVILAIAAGGNHTFAIGALLRDENGESSDLRSLLSRKFSLAANKGLGQIPVDATGVKNYLQGLVPGSEMVSLPTILYFIYCSFNRIPY
jgi:hypothetical protein